MSANAESLATTLSKAGATAPTYLPAEAGERLVEVKLDSAIKSLVRRVYSTAQVRYIPLHTVTYRYIPLHTVTCRCMPSRTVTYRYVRRSSACACFGV